MLRSAVISDVNNQDGSFDKEAVIAAVLESGVLGSSNHQKQLFAYLINAKHQGAVNRVKAYNIAVDAFQRPQDFDGGTDSIVRVEMFRLRANLETFNARSATYQLDLPKATYNISVRKRGDTEAAPSAISTLEPKKRVNAGWFKFALTALPLILLSSFFFLRISDRQVLATCSQILPNLSVNNVGSPSDTQIYIEKIIRSTLAQQTSFNVIGPGQSCGTDAAPLFKINYALAHQKSSDTNLVITVYSNNTRDIISSHHIMGSSVAASSDDEFYYELVKTANTFSMPDSALARAALTEAWPSQAKLDDYRCISLMYDSFSGGSDEDLKAVHDCLEKSVQRGNAPLDNYGALAANYLEKARRHEGLGSDEMFDKARLIIENTSGDWVHSAELTIANIYYEVQRPDFNAERLDSLLHDAETSFNTNPQVLLMVAWRYGYSLGKWEEAKNISDRVKRMYPIRDQSVFIIDAGYALMNSEGDTLMDACKRTYAENSVYINVIVNACARKAKDSVWYKATEENLRKLNAAGIEEKMEVFNSTKYDLQFSSNLKKFLEMGEDI